MSRTEDLARLRALTTPRLRCVPADVAQRLTAPQVLFCLQSAREVFYGGAAGGGKTYALLAAALQYVDVPGYAAILFRRTHKELEQPGQLMAVAHDWLDGTDAKWSETKKRWTFRSNATLHFGYMQDENDAASHKKGPSYQFIGWDELTEFPEAWYTAMFSRLRRPAEGRGIGDDGTSIQQVPLRMRGASNPGGAGHVWVKERFVDPETRKPGAFFIPAKVTDNPNLDQASYIEGLQELAPLERARMLDGDWSAAEAGQALPRTSFQIVDQPPLPSVGAVRWWDLAATERKRGKREPDYTAGILLERLTDNSVCVTDLRHFQRGPADVQNTIRQTAIEDGIGIHIYLELEGGAGARVGLLSIKRAIGGLARVTGIEASKQGSKTERVRPLAAMLGNGNVYVLRRSWTKKLLDECEAWGAGGEHDDIVDALSGALSKLPEAPSGLPRGFQRQRAAPDALSTALEHIRRANAGTTLAPPVQSPFDIKW